MDLSNTKIARRSRVQASAVEKPCTFPGAICRRDELLDTNDIENINSVPLQKIPALKSLLWENSSIQQGFNLWRENPVEKLGEPNALMSGYASKPLAWVFDDSTGVTFVIISDGLNRESWRGATYEASLPQGISDKDIVSATSRLIEILK